MARLRLRTASVILTIIGVTVVMALLLPRLKYDAAFVYRWNSVIPARWYARDLGSEDLRLRRRAAWALRLRSDREDVRNYLVRSLGDSDASVRGNAIDGLAECRRTFGEGVPSDAELAQRLALIVRDDPAPEVRFRALIRLVGLGLVSKIADPALKKAVEERWQRYKEQDDHQ